MICRIRRACLHYLTALCTELCIGFDFTTMVGIECDDTV